MSMVRQVQVNAAVGMTFANALRSILRQDPDVVFVGEVRDEETARISIQAALTGHLVLSSLHTNDARGTSRLRDLACPAFAINAASVRHRATPRAAHMRRTAPRRIARAMCCSVSLACTPTMLSIAWVPGARGLAGGGDAGPRGHLRDADRDE